MKYRFDNEPDKMDVASMFRALAVLADRGKIWSVKEDDGDLSVGAAEFAGCLGTFYEEHWVRQLIKNYDELEGGIRPHLLDPDAVVAALVSMFSQYCGTDLTTPDGRRMFDHYCMSAGEEAADVLLAHKKISIDQLVAP